MSGRKGCKGFFENTADIIAEQARQRAWEKAERARKAQEAARQRLEQMKQSGGKRCTAADTRARTLLVAPLSQFADNSAVRSVLQVIEQIRAELATGGLSENRVLQLSSLLEAQECQLKESVATANGHVQRQRKLEQRLFEIERELVAFSKPLDGRFQTAEMAARLRQDATALRRRLEKTNAAELATLESEIGAFHRQQQSEFQRVSAIAEEVRRQQTRMQEVRQRLDKAAVEYTAYWQAAEAEPCLRELDLIQEQLKSISKLSDAQEAGGRLTTVEMQVNELIAAAKARQRVEHLAAEERALEELSERLLALDRKIFAKFGGAAGPALERHLENVRRLLKAANLEQARRDLATLKPVVGDFLTQTQQALRQWEAARSRAQDQHEQVVAQWMPVRGDTELRQRLPSHGAPTEAELRGIQQEIDDERFDTAAQRAAALQSKLTLELASARKLVDVDHALQAVFQELSTLHEATDSRFDSIGRGNVESYLSAGQKALTQSQLELAVKLLSDAQRTLKSHRETALQQYEKYRIERDAASEKLSHARDLVQGLQHDEVVCRWDRKTVDSLLEKLNRAESAIAAGRCGEAEKLAESIAKSAADITESVKPLESQADLQRRMASSIETALGEMGFDCNSGAEDPTDPKSAIILQAERLIYGNDTPGKINVAVESTGSLEYNVGGAFEKSNDYDSRLRRPVSRCDEAEEKLLELHSILRGMGIKTTAITWPGKRPDNDTGEELTVPDVDQQQFDDEMTRTRERGQDAT